MNTPSPTINRTIPPALQIMKKLFAYDLNPVSINLNDVYFSDMEEEERYSTPNHRITQDIPERLLNIRVNKKISGINDVQRRLFE